MRSRSVLDEIDQIVNELKPIDENSEVVDGDAYSLNCEICEEKPVSIMWAACNQDLTCKRCAVRIVTTQNQSTITTKTKIQCSYCNIETNGMIEFELREKNNN
ncbi:hypothetical protein KQX54_019983 [Cotesia glomerata]|uniref:Uncharacterized protein n=1 Tax=Cotesia glomerata TaxID=32391 RepID=A0AAV7IQU7_COTGL|nr:hypothetical protein KQX54_019983 [Cotesia glomerata]